jgi:hypothetical protein
MSRVTICAHGLPALADRASISIMVAEVGGETRRSRCTPISTTLTDATGVVAAGTLAEGLHRTAEWIASASQS